MFLWWFCEAEGIRLRSLTFYSSSGTAVVSTPETNWHSSGIEQMYCHWNVWQFVHYSIRDGVDGNLSLVLLVLLYSFLHGFNSLPPSAILFDNNKIGNRKSRKSKRVPQNWDWCVWPLLRCGYSVAIAFWSGIVVFLLPCALHRKLQIGKWERILEISRLQTQGERAKAGERERREEKRQGRERGRREKGERERRGRERRESARGERGERREEIKGEREERERERESKKRERKGREREGERESWRSQICLFPRFVKAALWSTPTSHLCSGCLFPSSTLKGKNCFQPKWKRRRKHSGERKSFFIGILREKQNFSLCLDCMYFMRDIFNLTGSQVFPPQGFQMNTMFRYDICGGHTWKLGKWKKWKFSFFHQRHALSMSFDIFVGTCRVTNVLPKLLHMLLFSMEKMEFPFLNSLFSGVAHLWPWGPPSAVLCAKRCLPKPKAQTEPTNKHTSDIFFVSTQRWD